MYWACLSQIYIGHGFCWWCSYCTCLLWRRAGEKRRPAQLYIATHYGFYLQWRNRYCLLAHLVYRRRGFKRCRWKRADLTRLLSRESSDFLISSSLNVPVWSVGLLGLPFRNIFIRPEGFTSVRQPIEVQSFSFLFTLRTDVMLILTFVRVVGMCHKPLQLGTTAAPLKRCGKTGEAGRVHLPIYQSPPKKTNRSQVVPMDTAERWVSGIQLYRCV